MSFAKKMIELRKQNGLSQQDLADRLGVSRQAISRWETGAVQPLADSVRGLVTAVSTAYYLQWKERQPVSMYDLPTETAEESIRDRSVITFSFDEW